MKKVGEVGTWKSSSSTIYIGATPRIKPAKSNPKHARENARSPLLQLMSYKMLSPSKRLSIPERVSSKRHHELTVENKLLEIDLREARKKLKPSTSFDIKFWQQAAECSAINYKILDNQSRLQLIEFEKDGGSPCDWWSSPSAQLIVEKLKAETVKKKIFQKQADKIEKSSPFRRSIIHLFTTCQKGLGIIDAGFGDRQRSDQRYFKKRLLKEYALIDRNHHGMIWDVCTGSWRLKDMMTAAHIYPVGWGKDFMQGIFGETAKYELFSPKNGLMLLKPVEKAFDDGAIVIVPDIPNDPLPQQVEVWNKSNPKEFKFRILDSTVPCLQERISESAEEKTVADLDGKQLQFRSNFRPRTRYLYFMFCVAVLRLAWRCKNQNSEEALSKQLGKGFWGTRGKYVRKGILLAFVEEIGHGIEFLVDGGAIDAVSKEDDVPDETGLLAIADSSLAKSVEDSDDSDSDSSDSDRSDDFDTSSWCFDFAE